MDALEEIGIGKIVLSVPQTQYSPCLFRSCHTPGGRIKAPVAEMRHLLRFGEPGFTFAEVVGTARCKIKSMPTGRNKLTEHDKLNSSRKYATSQDEQRQ